MTSNVRPDQFGWRSTTPTDQSAVDCSTPRCTAQPVVATRMHSSGLRHYCADHARLRGIVVAPDGSLAFDRETARTLVRISVSAIQVR